MSWLIVILYIFTVSLYGGLETGGYMLNRIRLGVRMRHGSRSASELNRVLSDMHLFIFTVLIGQNIAVYLVSRQVTSIYLKMPEFASSDSSLMGLIPWNAETAATLTLMLPLFVLGEVFPKNLFRKHSDVLMYRLSSVLFFSWWVFRPFTVMLKKCFSLMTPDRTGEDATGEFSLSVQGLRQFFIEDESRPVLSERQHGMIENLMYMDRIFVHEIMRPITSIVSVSEKATVGEALQLMKTRSVDQLAVYSGSVRCISGWLSLFDLMDPDLDLGSPVGKYARKANRISVRQSVAKAFRRLRLMPSEPLFVVDALSRTVGRIYLRDVAAYIVSSK